MFGSFDPGKYTVIFAVLGTAIVAALGLYLNSLKEFGTVGTVIGAGVGSVFDSKARMNKTKDVM